MENFEEKRQEYFKRLEEYLEFVTNIPKNKKNKKFLKIIQNPKNEEELNYANKRLRFAQDCRSFEQNYIEGNIEQIDLKNCFIVDIFSDIVILMMEQSNASIEEEKIFERIRKSIYLQALIVYEILALRATNLENINEIIKDKCNIDTNSMKYRLISTAILIDWNEKFDEWLDKRYIINKKSMDEFIKFADIFHKLCVKGIKQNSDSKSDELLDTLIDSYKQKKKIKI